MTGEDRVPVPRSCPQGHSVPPGHLFCPTCGLRMPSTASPDHGPPPADGRAIASTLAKPPVVSPPANVAAPRVIPAPLPPSKPSPQPGVASEPQTGNLHTPRSSKSSKKTLLLLVTVALLAATVGVISGVVLSGSTGHGPTGAALHTTSSVPTATPAATRPLAPTRRAPGSRSPVTTTTVATTTTQATTSTSKRKTSSSPRPRIHFKALTIAAIAKDLSASSKVRPTVQKALNDFELCRITGQGGAQVLQHSMQVRSHVIAGLSRLSPTSLPEGRRLLADLRSALADSIAADGDFARWMEITGTTGSCDRSPGQDPNYQAGLRASQAANQAKRAFLSLWNPIARAHGRATYKAGQI